MHTTRTLDPTALATPDLHGYLLAAVAPRPIAFASTVDKAGRVNLSPFSFFNVFSANPPVMIFSPARRTRDNTTKHTYENILEVPEVVVNIVNFPIVEQMSLASTEYARGVNEFEKAGLTQIPSQKVKPPRVGEAPVAFECEVDQVVPLGTEGGAGNLILARVVLLHVQEAYLDADGKLDTTQLDLVGRMGGSWYCRAGGDALFQIPKPLRTQGIGVDQLPAHVRNSSILTGNDLGRLGNLEHLPDPAYVEALTVYPQVQALLNAPASEEALHRLAQHHLRNGDAERALALLLIGD